ncbi:MAG: energy-coupling factor transporter transmembrane component T [Dehalococcoidales bacterium]|jgi:energy-coupling factor transport system permease protein|nr:energy-coupling factor transporter transmembrane component T [Dehalococcoidales bacterium]
MPQFFFNYQNKDNYFHRLNPVVKLVWASSIIIIAMLANHPVILALLLLCTLPTVFAGGIWRQWAVIMQLTLWMGIMVMVINCLANPGGSHLLWQSWFSLPIFGHIRVTLEAIIYGLFMTVRLMAIISAFSVITLTIHPDELLSAMLEMRLPYKTAMMAALSIRFVPTMFEDATRIADAQRSRGLEMDKGSKFERLRRRAPILTSLLSSSLERTIQLAEAMEARAFGSSSKRSRFFRLAFSKLDITMIVFLLLMLLLALYILLSGGISYEYFPSLQRIDLSTKGLVMAILVVSVLAGLVPAARLGESNYHDKV